MNYQQQSTTGEIEKLRRINIITIYNHLNQIPEIALNEIEQTILPDGTIYERPTEVLRELFDKPETTFDLLNPEDDSVIGESTYQNLYIMLYGLARKLQNERDTQKQNVETIPAANNDSLGGAQIGSGIFPTITGGASPGGSGSGGMQNVLNIMLGYGGAGGGTGAAGTAGNGGNGAFPGGGGGGAGGGITGGTGGRGGDGVVILISW